MDFIPVKTRKFVPPQDRGKLFELLDENINNLKNRDIVVITSKIVSIHQGRFVPARSMAQKLKLIKQEAEGYLPGYLHGPTIKAAALIPYAGIDRTNSNNHYVLLPEKPYSQAQKIWQYLRIKFNLNQLGIIIIDSFCLPLRWGHFGISVGFFGFHPNKSYQGRPDIFGHKIIAGNSNLVDALAAIAGVMIGEGNEQTPLLIIRGFPKLRFTDKATQSELLAEPQKDMFSPLLKAFRIPKRIGKKTA